MPSENKKYLKLKIDPELDELFTDLKIKSEWTYRNLKEDIAKNGIKNELIVSQDGTVVCGHQRFKIAKELELPIEEIPIKVMEFKNRQDMIDYAITDNILRRNMNNYEKGLLGIKLLPRFEKEAEKRKAEAGKKYGRGRKKVNLELNEPNFQEQSLQQAADRVGIGFTTFYKIKKINDSKFVSEKEKLELRNDQTSVSAIYDRIRRKETEQKIAEERKQDRSQHGKSKGKRFSPKLEDKIIQNLNEKLNLIRCPKPNEGTTVSQDNVSVSNDWVKIVAKTEEAKRVLARFIHPTDEKEKKLDKGNKFDLVKMNHAIELMKNVESSAAISKNGDEPLVIENQHFKIILRGI